MMANWFKVFTSKYFWAINILLIILAVVPDPSDAVDFGTPALELGALVTNFIYNAAKKRSGKK